MSKFSVLGGALIKGKDALVNIAARNPRVTAAAGAVAATTTIIGGLTVATSETESTDDQLTATTGSINNNGLVNASTLNRRDVTEKYFFPLDLESNLVPHVFIKIFETETGAVESTDLTTTAFRGGADSVKNFVADNATTAAAVVGGAYGAFYGGAIGLLRGGAGGVLRGLGVGAAAGAVTGAAAAELAPVAAETVINQLGDIVGVENVSNRAKTLISNFALKRNIQQLKTAIALLMPETLSVSYQNDYGAISFTQAAGGVGQLAQAVGSDLGKTGNPDPFIAEAAGRLAEKFISEDFARLGFFATTGRTINPQLELIYNSPQLRDFVLDFRLVPRNSNESEAIRLLINRIKYYAAPRIPKDTGGRYFIPPAQFELEFYHADQNQNKFLFKTKKCVLEDISVDYTGNGAYATFYDGAPVEVRLSLRFKETVVIDRDAVDNGF